MSADIVKVALNRVVPEKDYKAEGAKLSPGIVRVDRAIRLFGDLKKSEPYTQRFSAAANPWALLARALSKLNAATLESLVRESLEVPEAEQEAVKAAADAAIERLVSGTERVVSGRITSTLQYELLA